MLKLVSVINLRMDLKMKLNIKSKKIKILSILVFFVLFVPIVYGGISSPSVESIQDRILIVSEKLVQGKNLIDEALSELEDIKNDLDLLDISDSDVPDSNTTVPEPTNYEFVNLIENPSVELDADNNDVPDSWTPHSSSSGVVASTSWFLDGANHVLRSDAYEFPSSYDFIAWQQHIDSNLFSEDTTYSFRVRYKTETEDFQPIMIKINYYNSNWGQSATPFVAYLDSSNNNWVSSGLINFTTPAGEQWDTTTRITLYLRLTEIGTAFFDDIELLAKVATSEPFNFVVLKGEFHTHSTASDGNFTPSEVVQKYYDAGYDVIALTDHNTVDGFQEALAYAENLNMSVIRGEELTYNFENGQYKHVIGLFLEENVPITPEWDSNDLVEPLFNAIHSQGGLGYVAHPMMDDDVSFFTEFEDSKWSNFTNATYIDGWKTSRLNETTTQFLLSKGFFSVFEHDYHDGELPVETYNLLFCYNNTINGIREAFESRRIVSINQQRIVGTNEALELYLRYIGQTQT